MSQLSIKLSDKADALIAQLQKEIFNRRRKKVTASGVVETLVESGARSQSDKRFSTSWVNLIQDIEKAAKLANAHGSKPSSLTDEEWVMVLSHRNRQSTGKTVRQSAAKKPAAKKRAAVKTSAAKAPAAKASAKASVKKTATRKSSTPRAAKKTTTTSASVSTASKPRAARRARKATKSSSSGSVAGRMAKAAAQLGSGSGITSPARS
jgi:nitroreductase